MPLALLASKILNRVPKFLRGPNLGRFQEAFAATLDGSDQMLRIGMTGNNPLICPAECLPTIAKDRAIPLFTSTPIESQRHMLADWIMLHRTRGSHYGVMRLVRHYFDPGPYPTLRIVHQCEGLASIAEWHTLDAAGRFTITQTSPSNWSFDGQTSKWARWWLIVHMPAGYVSKGATWDGVGSWDDGVSLWDGVTAGMLADLYAAARGWKRAGTWFGGMIVTQLQPTDDIPGFVAGHHPFDPTATALTHTDGWTTLPLSNWGSPIYTGASYTGLATRPPWATFYNIDNG